MIPPFGRDGIRKINSNRSELKKLTAHDYEDMLQVSLNHADPVRLVLIRSQVAIPVFKGLIPGPDGERITKLLFVMAHWHGLAKLRMHTDSTLAILKTTTTQLGEMLREFKDKTCPNFATKELAREAQARVRRSQKASEAFTSTAQADGKHVPSLLRVAKRRLMAKLSGRKLAQCTARERVQSEHHKDAFPGGLRVDYCQIRNNRFLLHSDSKYSIYAVSRCADIVIMLHKVELMHRYATTRFPVLGTKDIASSLATMYDRETRIDRIDRTLKRKRGERRSPDSTPSQYARDDKLAFSAGKTENHSISIFQLVQQHRRDPAVKVLPLPSCIPTY